MTSSSEPVEEQRAWLTTLQTSPHYEMPQEALDARARCQDDLIKFHRLFDGASNNSIAQVPGTKRISEAYRAPMRHGVAAVTRDLLRLVFDCPEDYLIDDEMNRVYIAMNISASLFEQLSTTIRPVIRAAVDESEEFPAEDVLTDFLGAWTSRVRNSISLPHDNSTPISKQMAHHRWAQALDRTSENFSNALAAAKQAELLKETQQYRDLARDAASDAGAASLGGHFREIYDTERISVWLWTTATIVTALSAIGGAVWLIRDSTDPDWIKALLHLAIVLPLFGLSAYFARIARHHRLLGRWARTSAAQVNSIGAFALTAPSDRGREELILTLGHTVFGPPAFADDSKTEHISAIPPEIIDLMKEIVRRERP
ncbi:hypothetical protein K1X22_01305 [Mycolicibacterium farcinogenes]|uniref:hypothetical protein n=1 Tax=Mycolicibacterium farcinogenes TaxID=1802 RepID=UPI001C8D4BFA|nr:hypothetical protein [Mycolicibacterium farcinogenes]QZH60497.1 hypothetical protein K1X22_01305 [Mycolicibacterium farcinogenes]